MNRRMIFIIPEFGNRPLTMKLIGSILESDRHQNFNIAHIIISDDGKRSPGKFSVRPIKFRKQPAATEVSWPENVQFAENVNRAIHWVNPNDLDILIIVNTDITFHPNTIPMLMTDVLETQGVIGPAVLDPVDGTHLQVHDQKSYTERSLKLNAAGAYKLTPMTALSGCCMAMPASVWWDLGGFDHKNFRAFFEDDDFCIRANVAGHPVLYDPRCFVYHLRGATMRAGETNHDQELIPISRDRFKEKWPEISWDPTGLYKIPDTIRCNDPRLRIEVERLNERTPVSKDSEDDSAG